MRKASAMLKSNVYWLKNPETITLLDLDFENQEVPPAIGTAFPGGRLTS